MVYRAANDAVLDVLHGAGECHRGLSLKSTSSGHAGLTETHEVHVAKACEDEEEAV